MTQHEKDAEGHSHSLPLCPDKRPASPVGSHTDARDHIVTVRDPAWKALLKRVLRHRPSPMLPVTTDALVQNWTFVPSRPDGITIGVRAGIVHGLVRAPAHRCIRPITPADRWICYFVYLPTGGLTLAHRYTLHRLRQADARLCVICAGPSPNAVPAELMGMADAVYWKALQGFDFSAYALAVHEIASYSSGADLLMLNDSVFGPFVPVDTLWPAMQWDLTGFTASAQLQNHLQSYAFHLKHVDAVKARALRSVLFRHFSFNHYRGAVYGQESRFATVAARTMSVGALWYADGRRAGDPSVFAALPLLNVGFPFLKRSLLSKNAHTVSRADVIAALRLHDHPIET